MADVTVTAANVLASSQAKIAEGTAGATVTAGQPVYADPADSGKLKPADANASATTAKVAGIALHGAASGQPLKYVIEDPDFTPGFTIDLTAAGQKGVYLLSANAGGIAPFADAAAGWYPVLLMVGKSASKAVLKMQQGTAVLT